MAVTSGDRTIKMTALNDSTTQKVRITQITWSGAGAASQQVIIKLDSDGGGDEIFNVTSGAAGDTVRVPMDIVAPNGFKMTTFTAGEVLVYIA